MPHPTESTANAQLAALRSAGAASFDPVRLNYMEALLRRTQAHQGQVQHILQNKLSEALVVFTARFENHQSNVASHARSLGGSAFGSMSPGLRPPPFTYAERTTAQAPGPTGPGPTSSAAHRTALGDLVRSLAQQSSDALAADRAGVPQNGLGVEDSGNLPGGSHAPGATPPELKSIRQFRATWSKLSVDKQLSQALDKAPKNAGPINSHMLVLRSLALMRDISPDYLNRFMSYADTLLCLDHYDQEKHFQVKKPPVAKPPKPPKPPEKRSRKK